jgi:NAD(P)-dependent dehydrogenase (short-subunit alcohol dehydrogenase family)
MKQVIVITGASSGFGALAARALAHAGHTVYATMRETTGRNAPQVAEVARYAAEHGVDLVIHNAGHMSFGPAEAFTPEQFAQLYDVNVLSTHRVNRAALPHMRKQRRGLVVWVSSSSTRGGTPPYLSPYFAAKAAMDSLAVSYAGELARWGIETSIIVPGAFTKGTNHFAHAGSPADKTRTAEYDEGPYAGLREQALKGLASLEPADADVGAVAEAIVKVVGMPFGKRPFRTHIDPSRDGCEIVNGVADRVRAEMFRRIGLEDLLSPRVIG